MIYYSLSIWISLVRLNSYADVPNKYLLAADFTDTQIKLWKNYHSKLTLDFLNSGSSGISTDIINCNFLLVYEKDLTLKGTRKYTKRS